MANVVDPDQTAPSGGVWSGSTLFAEPCVSEYLNSLDNMSHVVRLPVLAICEQQRCRSVCTSEIQNFKTLVSIWSRAGRFESYLVENPKDRFSRDEAHMAYIHCQNAN